MKHINVTCTFLQIYNEKIYDLLNTSKTKKTNVTDREGLRIRWSKKEEFTVSNLYNFQCHNAEECL